MPTYVEVFCTKIFCIIGVRCCCDYTEREGVTLSENQFKHSFEHFFHEKLLAL